MSPTALLWIKALHLFGIFMWIGTMNGLLNTLVVHGRCPPEARPTLSMIEKRTAMFMDIGGTIAIVFGAILLAKIPGIMKHGYMHAKLGLVVLMFLGMHGFLRVQTRKFRDGQIRQLPTFLPPMLMFGGLAVLILVVVKPF